MVTDARRDELVTGEAVAVELPGAGLGLRVLSGLVDVVLAVVVLVVAVLLFGDVVSGLDEALGAGVGLVATVGVLVLLPAVTEHLTGGRTLGKRITGLRTVRADGGPADLRRYLTRHLIGFVEVWLLAGGPALVSALATARTQRLGDLAAGTVVTRDRRALRAPEPIVMPPALASWAAHAQIGALPPDLVARTRRLLRHGAQLDPDLRARLAGELAAQLSDHVAPPPPAGARDDDVCRAVLARRLDLDGARLDAQDRLRARLFEQRPRG
ncbi:RDD family protein [Agilicoccus flavus]|uniref:RDD family protein n=1 Tax=Agilicoccus flavus TaxID=2775968 RepID=UPI001CF6A1E7|nr:RDD family protein [Agilicoccus flavus]